MTVGATLMFSSRTPLSLCTLFFFSTHQLSPSVFSLLPLFFLSCEKWENTQMRMEEENWNEINRGGLCVNLLRQDIGVFCLVRYWQHRRREEWVTQWVEGNSSGISGQSVSHLCLCGTGKGQSSSPAVPFLIYVAKFRQSTLSLTLSFIIITAL